MSKDIEQVIKITEIIEENNRAIVSPFSQGKDIVKFAIHHDIKQFNEQHVKFLTYHIAQGIRKLHLKGIIHRDIKLENILMQTNDFKAVPVIGDFGFAVHLEDGETCNRRVGS